MKPRRWKTRTRRSFDITEYVRAIAAATGAPPDEVAERVLAEVQRAFAEDGRPALVVLERVRDPR